MNEVIKIYQMEKRLLCLVVVILFAGSIFAQTDSLLLKIRNKMAATTSYESDCVYSNSFTGKQTINQKIVLVRNPDDTVCGFYFRFFNDSIFPASADAFDFVIYNGDAFYSSYKWQIKKTVRKDYPEKFVEINKIEKDGGILTKPSLLTSQFFFQITLFQLEKEFNKCLSDSAFKRVVKKDTVLHNRASVHIAFRFRGSRDLDFFFDKASLDMLKYVFVSRSPTGTQFKIADFYNVKTNQYIPLAYFSESNLLPDVKLDNSEPRKKINLKGMVAPDWTLPLLKSKDSLSLSRLKGKIVLFEFTAVWCVPCRFAIVMMENLKAKYAYNKNIVLISAYLDAKENEETIMKLAKPQNQNNFVLYNATKVWELYKQFSVPVFFVIDEQGKIVEQYNGYSDKLQNQLVEKIDRIRN